MRRINIDDFGRLQAARFFCVFGLWFCDLLLAAALPVMALAWLLDPFRLNMGPVHFTAHWGLKPILMPFLILAARQLLAQVAARRQPGLRGLWESAVFKKIFMAFIVTFAFLTALEWALAWSKFDAALPPVVFQGQDNQGGIEIVDTLPDPELMFKFPPGGYFAGRLINSLGFRDREVDPRKPPGAFRVICMGDSVTAQGRPGYSQYLHERLSANPPTPGVWEAFNMGVHGYTSLQGLRLFQKSGRGLKPDIVTLYYGWNDHFLTSVPDRMHMGLEMRPLAGRIFELLRRKRIFRLVVWALSPVQHLAARELGEGRVPRVSPDEYHSTLTAFVREIRAAGAIPVLITAPRRSLPDGLIAKEYVTSVEQGERIHDEYAEITRRVAAESKAELLDLAAIFADAACDSYFERDGIHFDYYATEGRMTNDPAVQPGLMRIAEELDRKVRAITRTPAWRARHPDAP